MAVGDMIFLFATSGTWTVPTGVTAIKVECFGNGIFATSFSEPQLNYPGGSYSQTSTLSVTPGSTIYINTSPTGSTNSWVNKTSNASPTSTADGCLAVSSTTPAASQVAANVGDIKYAGGNGAISTGTNLSARGGQAGPNGPGADVGAAYSATGVVLDTTYYPATGGGANGGVSGGLGSIPYGRSGGAFGGNGGYWDGSAYVSPTQDVLGQAQYVNGFPLKTPINYGPFGGAACRAFFDSGDERFEIENQRGFVVITVLAPSQKTIFFGSDTATSGSFTLPSDFGSLVSLRAVGGGGINTGGITATNGGGGGGGGYSETSGASVTASMVAGSTLVYYNLPAPAAGSSASSWINIGTNSAPTSVTSGVLAFSGGNTSINTGGIGGPTASAVGNTRNAGGAGGTGFTSTRNTGGGGGGAGGPFGTGGAGGNASTATGANRGGGGGGAVSSGGTGVAGGAGATSAGGAGGFVSGGSGGAGATNSSPATTSANGNGGGGGTSFSASTGSTYSFQNGLFYISSGDGGKGGATGVTNSGGAGGGGVIYTSVFPFTFASPVRAVPFVALTYNPATPPVTDTGNFFFLF